MSDAQARRELEDTQMELRRLKEELAAWPAISPERADLEEQLAQLGPHIDGLRDRLAALNAQEAATRDQLARLGGVKWWTSPPFMVVAGIAAVVAAIWLAERSFDYVNWPLWAPRVAPALLAVAPVVNGLRIARSWLRKRKVTG